MAIEHQIVMQDGATAAGNGTELVCAGHNVAAIQVAGINGDTITWESTISGTWAGIRVTGLGTGTAALTATVDGLYQVTVAGLRALRARVSTYGSGTITVVGRVTDVG